MSTQTSSTDARAVPWLLTIISLAALVPRVLHELSHAIVGAPFAHQVSITFSVDDTAAWCDVEFRESAPSWGVWLAFLAPFVLGVGFLVATAAYAFVAGLPLPANVEGWLWASMLGIWWTVFAYPSKQDRQGAREVTAALDQDDDDDTATDASGGA
jgi:hypothetical protein